MHGGKDKYHRRAGRDFLYRRMVSEARGDLFVKATCLYGHVY